jgi:exosortase/archaeosortase family protein
VKRSSVGRVALASVALALEYLLISLRFDAETLLQLTGRWGVLGRVGALATLGLVVATSAFVLREAPAFSRRAEAPLAPVRFDMLALHALLYGAFFALTHHLFGGVLAGGQIGYWFLAWSTLGVASALSLLFGLVGLPALRAFLAPGVVIAGLAVGSGAWFAGSLTAELWRPLSAATLALVALLMRPFFEDFAASPEELTVRLNAFAIDIAPECSGFEGIGLIFVLISCYLIAFRNELRFPAALALLPIAIGAVWVGNALRIALLMLLGAYVDETLALGGFHSKAGWAFFCAIGLGLAVWGRRSSLFARQLDEPGVTTDNPTAAYLMPELGIIAGGLVTGMFARTVDLAYGVGGYRNRLPISLRLPRPLPRPRTQDHCSGRRSWYRRRSLVGAQRRTGPRPSGGRGPSVRGPPRLVSLALDLGTLLRFSARGSALRGARVPRVPVAMVHEPGLHVGVLRTLEADAGARFVLGVRPAP